MRLSIESLRKQLALIGVKKDTVAARAVKELIEYKEIEKEFGVDLVTLSRMMTDGCYYLRFKEIFHFKPDAYHFVSMNFENKSVDLIYTDEYAVYMQVNLMINGYGTEWALTEEELL